MGGLVWMVRRTYFSSWDSWLAGLSSQSVLFRGTGCQNLRYTLMTLDSFDIIQQGPVPLGKGVTLKWMGITTEGVRSPPFYFTR